MAEPFERVVRTPRCYLVARGDGRVVLGATMEEQGFDTAVTADGVYRLLEAAWEVLPEVGELELVRARGRAAAGHARQRAGGRARASSTGWSGPPATGATACCWRRSPARSWPTCWRASRCPSARGARARRASRSARRVVRDDGRDVNGERRELRRRRDGGGRGARAGRRTGGRGVAVALDGEVVPRGEWADHRAARRPGARGAARGAGRVARSAFEIAGRALTSRLILGTGGFRSLEVMAAAARESGAELATVAMRRVDPTARGSILEVLEEAGLEVLPEHRRLLHRARGGDHRPAGPRGARAPTG